MKEDGLKMIDYILNELTNQTASYIFHNGNPVDIRRKKYWLWRKWFNDGNLKCRCCGIEATEIRDIKCSGDGSLHKPSRLKKHNFKLFNKDGGQMTLDHWIPKSFLRKKGFDWKSPYNLVLMCNKCNVLKADMIPANWESQYALMHLETF